MHLKDVYTAAFRPDDTRVVTASADGTARVWRATTGKPLGERLQHLAAVRTVAFSPVRRRNVRGMVRTG